MRTSSITGLILAGGRATRMGGLDKGLQLLNGQPLIAHVLARLTPQVGPVLINANRHIDQYRALGFPVLRDATADFNGPLAGLLVGLQATRTDWLLCVPCDAPCLPLDLATRLMMLAADPIDVVFAVSGRQVQPTFCLLRPRLEQNLAQYLDDGGRKLEAWLRAQAHVAAPFDQPNDAQAFFNANSLTDLQQLAQGESSRPDQDLTSRTL